MNIALISASVRRERKSHWVALYFQKFIEKNKLASVELLDLNAYDFPVFKERLRNEPNPTGQMLDFTEKINSADGVLIVTPEYNGGYPASLKNVIDLLYAEWKRKPIALATVSDGSFGGSQVMTSLVFSLWKIGAWVVPAMFPVPKVESQYDNVGNSLDESIDKRAGKFLDELLWCMKAAQKMNSES